MSRGNGWRRVQDVEDLLALVVLLDDHRRVILIQAWHRGDWGAVYVEAMAMQQELAQLKAELSARWKELYAAVKK